jgi:hypothetical protein
VNETGGIRFFNIYIFSFSGIIFPTNYGRENHGKQEKNLDAAPQAGLRNRRSRHCG